MAIENEGTVTPESTGAVTTPSEPVTVEAAVGHPESTGAVEAPPAVLTTEFGDLGQSSTRTVETPGPQTSGPDAKVVKPTGRRAAEPTTTSAEVKQADTAAAPPASDGH